MYQSQQQMDLMRLIVVFGEKKSSTCNESVDLRADVHFRNELFCGGEAVWLVMQQKTASPPGTHWLRARCGAPPLSETDVGAGLGHPLSP